MGRLQEKQGVSPELLESQSCLTNQILAQPHTQTGKGILGSFFLQSSSSASPPLRLLDEFPISILVSSPRDMEKPDATEQVWNQSANVMQVELQEEEKQF